METIRVVAAVIEQDGLVLACRRAPHKSMAGYWEFPGGKVEPGESDEQALVREIKEELGVDIVVRDFLCSNSERNDGSGITIFAFRAEIVSGAVQVSTDHDELLWCTSDELLDLGWAPLDIAVTAAARGLA